MTNSVMAGEHERGTRALPCCRGILLNMTDALKHHWPEYLIEALSLGLFMISAFSFATLLEHPSSLVHQAITSPTLRGFLMGLMLDSTAIAIIYSPWGQQSGAHINPSTTFPFSARLPHGRPSSTSRGNSSAAQPAPSAYRFCSIRGRRMHRSITS